MKVRLISFAATASVFFATAAHAQTTANAHITIACSGAANAEVAVRWGHPKYSDRPQYLMPEIFNGRCDGHSQVSTNAVIDDPNSEFEIQTRGGIQTSYTVDVLIDHGPANATGRVTLVHYGSPNVVVRGTGFTLNRSAGPNRYGEQNFRVEIPTGALPTVRLVAKVTGQRNDTKFALRWGHPSYDKNKYLNLWKVAPGADDSRLFPIKDRSSEFEIQTEGGTGTGYHLQGWFNFGRGESMQSNIDIVHQLQGTDISTGSTGISFFPTHGNVYGEINVRVIIPGIPPPSTGPVADTGGGLTLIYDYGPQPVSTGSSSVVPIGLAGMYKTGSGQIVAGTLQSFGVITRSLTLNPGFDATLPAVSATNLQPGTWTVKVGPYFNGQFTGETTTCDVIVSPGTGRIQKVDRNAQIHCPS